jgi:hypothetical protein
MLDRAQITAPPAARRARVYVMRVLGHALLCMALYLVAPGDVWGTRHGRRTPVLTAAAPTHGRQGLYRGPLARSMSQ